MGQDEIRVRSLLFSSPTVVSRAFLIEIILFGDDDIVGGIAKDLVLVEAVISFVVRSVFSGSAVGADDLTLAPPTG